MAWGSRESIGEHLDRCGVSRREFLDFCGRLLVAAPAGLALTSAVNAQDVAKRVAKARMTVWHNGVMIHDDVELREHPDDAKPGGLYLQDQHRCDVRFRNIWALPGRGHTLDSVQGK